MSWQTPTIKLVCSEDFSPLLLRTKVLTTNMTSDRPTQEYPIALTVLLSPDLAFPRAFPD
jgi:hypothetical protein